MTDLAQHADVEKALRGTDAGAALRDAIVMPLGLDAGVEHVVVRPLHRQPDIAYDALFPAVGVTIVGDLLALPTLE